jgi:hypothetical protein
MSGSGEGAPSPTPDLQLSEQHRRMLLEESGIKLEIAEARGYRTVKKKVELEQLGFGRTQRNVPALLVPVHSPTGEWCSTSLGLTSRGSRTARRSSTRRPPKPG